MKIETSEFLKLAAAAVTRIELWRRIVGAVGVETMAEIGVWKGEFARQLLAQCDVIRRYYLIDPWANLPDWNKPFNVTPELFDEIHQEAMKNTEFAAARRVVLRGRTKEVIDEIPDRSLDLAYIDGDHTLRGITIDLIRLLPKMKEGGLIGGDDFTTSPWHHGLRYEPTLVCPFCVYFAEAMDLPVVALPMNQFVIQKRAGAAFSFKDLTGNYRDLSLNRLPAAR